MIADAKTTILSIGGVLDDDVDIRILPQFISDRYMGAIKKNYNIIILSTGQYIVVCTESNNTISIFKHGVIKNVNNFCNIPKDVFQSGRRYTGEDISIIKYFTFCKEKNRKWMGKMAVDHINRDRGDNRKVNLRLE